MTNSDNPFDSETEIIQSRLSLESSQEGPKSWMTSAEKPNFELSRMVSIDDSFATDK